MMYAQKDLRSTYGGMFGDRSPMATQGIATSAFSFSPLLLDNEREMCAITIYSTNIDKKVTPADVKLLFQSICGGVCSPPWVHSIIIRLPAAFCFALFCLYSFLSYLASC